MPKNQGVVYANYHPSHKKKLLQQITKFRIKAYALQCKIAIVKITGGISHHIFELPKR